MLSEYRQRFSEFHTALHRADYLFRSGRSPQRETAYVWREFSDLFQLSVLAELRNQLAEVSAHRATERTSIERLIAFVMMGYLAGRERELAAEIENYEEQARFEWDEQKINLEQADELLAREGDVQRRRELAARRGDAFKGAQDLRAEAWAQRHAAAQEMNYESYLALQIELRGVAYEKLAGAANKFLTQTESRYAAALAPLLAREANVSLDVATPADLAYLERCARFDHFFTRERMLEIYRELFANLGFKTEKQTNIELDTAARPNKKAAFCAPIQVPDEIKLVVNLSGGQANYREFLRSTGHAQSYAWTSRQLYPEFRWGGDEAVTASWGLLFTNLLQDEYWLLNTFGMIESRSLRRALAVFRLLDVRRQAALLNYEVEFHTGALSNAGARYAELLDNAVRVRHDEAEHLRATSDSFRPADALRAAAFEAQLRDYLKTKFGVRWWATRKAGEMLIDVWNTGRRYTVEELASLLGLGELDFDSLAAEMLAQVTA